MSIQNTGSCSLVFQLSFIDVLEGEILHNMENSKSFRKQTKNKKNNEKSNEKNNEKKERSIGKSSKKMEGRVDFDDKLLPNEHLAIYGGNLKRSDQIRFSFLNLDENRQLLVPEKKKVYLRNLTCFRLEISYFRISRISIQSDRILQFIASKICSAFQVEFGVQFQIDLKKTKVKKDEKSNYCHVALIKLTLGSATLQDFIMICSIN
ncbi:uncharacterized protein LOC102681621 [Apis dorsata]|uniref:uncharacterized protein LOC102681621 n=1 Tax=Apis dorsata TaxID=7462 RepID=UPI0012937041|nr:uncharacterized protein LOC102681621 [Apis dorsata]